MRYIDDDAWLNVCVISDEKKSDFLKCGIKIIKKEVSRFYYIIFFPILCQKAKKKVEANPTCLIA